MPVSFHTFRRPGPANFGPVVGVENRDADDRGQRGLADHRQTERPDMLPHEISSEHKARRGLESHRRHDRQTLESTVETSRCHRIDNRMPCSARDRQAHAQRRCASRAAGHARSLSARHSPSSTGRAVCRDRAGRHSSRHRSIWRVLRMSSRGLAFSTTKSALLPAATTPVSACAALLSAARSRPRWRRAESPPTSHTCRSRDAQPTRRYSRAARRRRC